jgi:hypothetical protein
MDETVELYDIQETRRNRRHGQVRIPTKPLATILPLKSNAKVFDDMNNYMAKLRERWSDPLLTALTVRLVLLLFILAPLQALGIFVLQVFELVFARILVVGVFVLPVTERRSLLC